MTKKSYDHVTYLKAPIVNKKFVAVLKSAFRKQKPISSKTNNSKKTDNFLKTYYLVDFENVNEDGLEGCDKLKATDYIHLFYTDNAKKINLDLFANHGSAELLLHKAPASKQSLDMHLVSYLGYLIGHNHGKNCSYIIISKDTDYDNLIKFWKERYHIDASRKAKISSDIILNKAASLTEQTTRSMKVSKIDTNKMPLYTEVQQTISKAYDQKTADNVAIIAIKSYGKKQLLAEVHNELRTAYPDSYLDLYALIKPVLKKYASTVSKQPSGGQSKTALNITIQKTLANAKMENHVINDVASLVVKNAALKNGEQMIYQTLISKYGQAQGQYIYNYIKNICK